MKLFKPLKKLCEEKRFLRRLNKLKYNKPMHCKTRREKCKTKQEIAIKMAKIFDTDKKELATSWQANQVFKHVKDKNVSSDANEFLTINLNRNN